VVEIDRGQDPVRIIVAPPPCARWLEVKRPGRVRWGQNFSFDELDRSIQHLIVSLVGCTWSRVDRDLLARLLHVPSNLLWGEDGMKQTIYPAVGASESVTESLEQLQNLPLIKV
jgi:hypothetical protein